MRETSKKKDNLSIIRLLVMLCMLLVFQTSLTHDNPENHSQLNQVQKIKISKVSMIDRWAPSNEEVSDFIEYSKSKGDFFTEEQVRKALPYIKSSDSLEVKRSKAAVVTTIVTSIGTGIVIGLGVQAEKCKWGMLLFGSTENCSCEKFVFAGVVGGLFAPISLIKHLGLDVAEITAHFIGEAVSLVLGEIATLLAEMSALPDIVGGAVCDFFDVGASEQSGMIAITSSTVEDRFLDDFVELSNTSLPSGVIGYAGLIATRNDGALEFDFLSTDTISLRVRYLPIETGNYTIRLYGTNQGVTELYSQSTQNISNTEIEHEVIFNESGIDLLNWKSGDDNNFTFIAEVEHNISGEFLSTDENEIGFRVVDISLGNSQPIVTYSYSIESNILHIDGAYNDPDIGDSYSLEYSINGVWSNDFTIEGAPHTGMRFNKNIALSNGVHDVSIRYTDGVIAPREIGSQQIRASSTTPQVIFNLNNNQVDIGEPAAFSVNVVDAVGPIPNREVRISTDNRGHYKDSANNISFRMFTDASGNITGTYIPAAPGPHFLLAQDMISKNFSYETIDVGGNNPSDWTMEWVWQVVSNTATQAVYDASIRVQYQGANLDFGDDIYFSANHGSFSNDWDEVQSNGFVYTTYTLSKSEADSGPEIFTLDLPSYGVELVYSTNLLVGPPPPLQSNRTTSISVTPSNNLSFGIAYSKDGRYVARVENNKVHIMNYADLSLIRTVTSFDNRDMNAVSFSPDGNSLVAADEDGLIYIINVSTGSVIQKDLTSGRRDVINVHWFDSNQIAAVTDGNVTNAYIPRIFLLNSSGTVTRTIFLNGVTSSDDIVRIVCNPTNNLCATSIGPKWFLVTTTGSEITSAVHPDNNDILAIAFNDAGNRLFVGGKNNNGSTWLRHYSVNGTSLNLLSTPITSNEDIYAAGYVERDGNEKLGLWGNSKLELFDSTTGAISDEATPPGGSREQAFQVIYVENLDTMVTSTRDIQYYFNLSGDYFGPNISVFNPPALPYRENSLTIGGTITDTSGILTSEYNVANGSWMPLSLDGSGGFEINLSDLSVGSTPVIIRSYDIYINESQEELNIVRLDDLQGPLISNIFIEDSTLVEGQVFSVVMNATDIDSDVASVVIKLSDTNNQVVSQFPLVSQGNHTYSGFYNTVGMSEGVYTVGITATDTSSNSNISDVNGAGSLQIISDLIFNNGFGVDTILNTISYWRLDTGLGDVIIDSIGSHHGSLETSLWEDNCFLSNCIKFSGAGTFFSIPASSILQSMTTMDLNFKLFLTNADTGGKQKVFKAGNSSSDQVIIDYFSSDYGNTSVAGRLGFVLKTSSISGWMGPMMEANRWYDIRVNYDSSTMNIYLDNALVGSYTSGSNRLSGLSAPIIFGNGFFGKLDEIVLSEYLN